MPISSIVIVIGEHVAFTSEHSELENKYWYVVTRFGEYYTRIPMKCMCMYVLDVCFVFNWIGISTYVYFGTSLQPTYLSLIHI